MSRRCVCVKGRGTCSHHTIPLGGDAEATQAGSHQRPCSGAVADREALRGTLGEAAPVETRTEPPRGTQGASIARTGIPAPGP